MSSRISVLGRAVCSAVVCGSLVSLASAGVSSSGDVSPADPSKWTSSTRAYIGNSSNGQVTADGGSSLYSGWSFIGDKGDVTVDGSGSQWNAGEIRIGGSLSVSNGASVYSSTSDPRFTIGVSVEIGGGTATVTGDESLLSTDQLKIHDDGTLNVGGGGRVEATSIYSSLNQLRGNGTVACNGMVIDGSLVFDRNHGPQHTLPFGDGGHLELDIDGSGMLGAGYRSSGTLTIADGVRVSSYGGRVGYLSGSEGVATVTGDGSEWNITNYLHVGMYGVGTLSVTDGGSVIGELALGGFEESGIGTVNVAGGGSIVRAGSIGLGGRGDGELNIDAGLVICNRLYAHRDVGYEELSYTVKLSSGGRLALLGSGAGSLEGFFSLMDTSIADEYSSAEVMFPLMMYWDADRQGWVDVQEGQLGVDYSLEYCTDGELSGYTVLSVSAVPEPATLSLLALGGLALLRKRRRLVLRAAMMLLVCLPIMGVTATASAEELIADSIAEYSGVQGQDGWYYGYYDYTSDADKIYDPTTEFIPIQQYFTGGEWDLTISGRSYWVNIDPDDQHPNGVNTNGRELWVIRRWVSDFTGEIRIDGSSGMWDAIAGDGVFLDVQVDGQSLHRRSIAWNDTGITHFDVTAEASVGTTVDFIVAPKANDYSDGTKVRGQIYAVPEPATMGLLALGGLAMLRRRK